MRFLGSRGRRRVVLLLAGLALGAGGPTTVAAFRSDVQRPGSSVTSIPDWVAPPINRAQVLKSQGGTPGYVKPGASYYLCSDVGSDSGNPASGLLSVTSNLSALTSTLVGQVLGVLSGSPPCSSSLFNRISGPHTVNGTTGTKAVSVTTRDNAGNTDTATRSVVIDGTAPAATNGFSITNGGATAGRAESNDLVTFTFDEPVDPHSIVSGWDGSPRSDVYARVVESGGNGRNDTIDFWRVPAPNTYVQVPVTSVVTGSNSVLLAGDYTGANVTFSGSTMEVAGNTVTIRLGTADAAATNLKTVTANTAMTWRTSNTIFDRAGNLLPAVSVAEGGTADPEF